MMTAIKAAAIIVVSVMEVAPGMDVALINETAGLPTAPIVVAVVVIVVWIAVANGKCIIVSQANADMRDRGTRRADDTGWDRSQHEAAAQTGNDRLDFHGM
ncbi:MAG: hypothetical protein JWO08_3214 [Verrucomicrobiaceae bacterium]|nr:hypothetical protein [Verrucomicrobiaceae bacterium]